LPKGDACIVPARASRGDAPVDEGGAGNDAGTETGTEAGTESGTCAGTEAGDGVGTEPRAGVGGVGGLWVGIKSPAIDYPLYPNAPPIFIMRKGYLRLEMVCCTAAPHHFMGEIIVSQYEKQNTRY